MDISRRGAGLLLPITRVIDKVFILITLSTFHT